MPNAVLAITSITNAPQNLITETIYNIYLTFYVTIDFKSLYPAGLYTSGEILHDQSTVSGADSFTYSFKLTSFPFSASSPRLLANWAAQRLISDVICLNPKQNKYVHVVTYSHTDKLPRCMYAHTYTHNIQKHTHIHTHYK